MTDNESTTNGQPTKCVLCGHVMILSMCGWAQLPDGRPLCHTDNHDCYFKWTVYGKRPNDA